MVVKKCTYYDVKSEYALGKIWILTYVPAFKDQTWSIELEANGYMHTL